MAEALAWLRSAETCLRKGVGLGRLARAPASQASASSIYPCARPEEITVSQARARARKYLCLANDIFSCLLDLPFAGKQSAYLPCDAGQKIRIRLRSPVVSGRGRLGGRQVPAAKFIGERLLRHIEEGTLVGCNLHQLRVGERGVIDLKCLLL